MNFFHLLTSIPSDNISADLYPSLIAAMAAYAAGTLSKKRKRKLKWKLLWLSFKNKFRKKKPNGNKKTNWGLLILALLLGGACIALIIALGGAKVFIWIGVILLIGILAAIA